mgnify:CR=1 FL=1
MTSESKKPLLPLRDIVIFPSIVVPLFVGRKKSIKALEEVMKSDKSVVLVTQKNSEVDEPGEKDIYSYGCLSKVLQLLKLPDGTVKVLVEGLARVKILEIEDDTKKFLCCKSQIIESENENEEHKIFATNLIKKFEKLSTLNKKDVSDFTKGLKSLKNATQLADNICSNLNIQIFEKQELLEIIDIELDSVKLVKFACFKEMNDVTSLMNIYNVLASLTVLKELKIDPVMPAPSATQSTSGSFGQRRASAGA